MTYYIISTNPILENLWQEPPLTYSNYLAVMETALEALKEKGFIKARIYKLTVETMEEINNEIGSYCNPI